MYILFQNLLLFDFILYQRCLTENRYGGFIILGIFVYAWYKFCIKQKNVPKKVAIKPTEE
ncbi:hypothetical protein TK11N_23370 [Tetragenococcus koreensis]|uniref:Uncharacterized protein n=1 Tax=Tetragenococcus koreensis TaxID=290335 RepID=A0AAN4ZRE9_9ENTE|nr:hypothetical protein TK11N_23370 [Tetragenococcus koreensis]GEQ55491.1 hypothetical protein TK2N_23350 [Tetragenococcus koreensis]GEQ57988.1 hypothetical protein TK4N_23310 [Tetragenococcus koreensis]